MRRDWRYIAAIAALTIVAVVRVASTHRVFSEVLDEPAHLAAGFEWFHGIYTIDASHPPAARILGALPLWLAGYPLPETRDMVQAGNELLYHGNRYVKTLARVRVGNLLLLAIAIVATAAWARRMFSDAVAIVAAALLTTLPPVLAHAGLMTTDLAALTALPLALVALDRFLTTTGERKGPVILLGLAIGFGLLAKFSFLVFFPPCALLLLVARRAFPRWKEMAIAAAVAFVVVWSGYRFDWRTTQSYHGDYAVQTMESAAPKPLKPFARWAASSLPLPAPAFFVGLGMLQSHNKDGHAAYLLGEVRSEGWWYY
ncbi:MAG TPA: glycosyltransferase family 39 protein, partial [Thermoanaerobaculia bacterium]|nr:glycosyltransferase family 39 protein [Thermoanaerobaculia bacterium]